MKRIKGFDPASDRHRPESATIRAIEAVSAFGGELGEALVLGARAGAWCAFVGLAFAIVFVGLVLAAAVAGLEIVQRFAK